MSTEGCSNTDSEKKWVHRDRNNCDQILRDLGSQYIVSLTSLRPIISLKNSETVWHILKNVTCDPGNNQGSNQLS